LLYASKRISLPRLLKKIYIDDNYDNELRPFGQDDITKVETELKLLQIDLDEKYQKLLSTVWIEMVNFNLKRYNLLIYLYNFKFIVFF
jgi:hypothetical protein